MSPVMQIGGNPGLVQAATKVLLSRPRSYASVIPPENAEYVFQPQTTPCDANGTTVELLAYSVEPGFLFRMTGLLVTYVGQPLADGLGQTAFTLDVDMPTDIGGTVVFPVLPSGQTMKGFDSWDFHLGSLDNGPWKIPGPMLYDPGEVVRLKVVTASPFPETAVSFIAIFEGWTWPQKRDDM